MAKNPILGLTQTKLIIAQARIAKLEAAVESARVDLAATLDRDFDFWSAPQNDKYRRIVYRAWRSLRSTQKALAALKEDG